MRRGHWPTSVVLAGWLIVAAALAGTLAIDRRLAEFGRSDLSALSGADAPFVVATLVALTVGGALARRRPRHPVGWLFLALGVLLPLGGVGEAYAAYGAVVRPNHLPAAASVGAVADTPFILWLILVALVLHLTPTGRPLSPAFARAAVVTTGCGVLFFVGALIHPGRLDPPLDDTDNPLAIDGVGSALQQAAPVLGAGTAAGVVIGVVSLVLRYRRATGVDRQGLSWMVLAAAPIPIFGAAVTVSASTGNEVAIAVAGSLFVAVLPVTAALSITRYHLFAVERILSRAITYVLVSTLLIVSYVVAVVALERLVGGALRPSRLVDVAATLIAVAVTAPAFRRVQTAVDRRFNRRRFEAVRRIREHVRHPDPVLDIEQVLRESLIDPKLRIAYWTQGSGTWVNADGRPTPVDDEGVVVERAGRRVARVSYNPRLVEATLVAAVADEAATELENVALRADLAQQLVEVQESRARLTVAQLAERHKIERDLHDGAQQRLLTLALQLRSAQSGTDDRRRTIIEDGIQQLQAAISELRELANGVHPSSLSTGGLIAALDDLATRSAVATNLDVTEERFPRAVEATAWFIICEASANAAKHAMAEQVEIVVRRDGDRLVLDVTDDGIGGADPDGSGLRGLCDRAESIGGRLVVQSDTTGTTVHAELPCAS